MFALFKKMILLCSLLSISSCGGKSGGFIEKALFFDSYNQLTNFLYSKTVTTRREYGFIFFATPNSIEGEKGYFFQGIENTKKNYICPSFIFEHNVLPFGYNEDYSYSFVYNKKGYEGNICDYYLTFFDFDNSLVSGELELFWERKIGLEYNMYRALENNEEQVLYFLKNEKIDKILTFEFHGIPTADSTFYDQTKHGAIFNKIEIMLDSIRCEFINIYNTLLNI